MLSKNLATPVADEEIRIETVSAFEDAVKRSFKFKALRILLLVVSFFVAIGALNVLMSAGLGMGNANALTYIQLVLGVALFVFALKVMPRFGSYATSSGYSDRLRQWIIDNRMYEEETLTDRHGNRKRVVSDSAVFNVWQDSDYLYVNARDDSNRYSDRILNMERNQEISRLMKLPLDSVESDFNGKTYKLRKRSIERLVVSEQDYANVNGYISPQWEVALDSARIYDFARAPHALVAGQTGGGKSVFVSWLILELLRRGHGAGIYAADPKKSDLSAMASVLPEGHVGTTPGQICGILRKVNEEMELRYAYMADPEHFAYGSDWRDHPDMGNGQAPSAVWLFIEELAALKAMCSKSEAEELERYLVNIVMKGRQAGVFVCCIMQKPLAENIPGGTSVRDQLGLRVALGSMGREGYAAALGSTASGYDFKPREGKGAGYIYIDDGTMTEPALYDAPYVDFKAIDFLGTAKSLFDKCTPADMDLVPIREELEVQPASDDVKAQSETLPEGV